MSKLKDLIDETRTSLQDLTVLLHKARLLEQCANEQVVPGRQEVQRCFDELLKAIERLPEDLHLEKADQQRQEIHLLLSEMDSVRQRVETLLGNLESVWEENLKKLIQTIESLTRAPQAGPPSGISGSNEGVQRLLDQAKLFFEKKDYDACNRALQQALAQEPDRTEARELLNEVSKRIEDEHLEEELVIHIENLKKEATDLFDAERYDDCVGMFRFLCELEPHNRTLRDYLDLTQQKIQEKAAGARPDDPVASPLPGDKPRLPESLPKEASPTLITSAPDSTPADLEVPSAKTDPRDLVKFPPEIDERHDEAEEAQFEPRKRLIWASACIGLMASVLAGYIVVRSKLPGPPPVFNTLLVDSIPLGATVKVNGRLRGQTPLQMIELQPGAHEISIEKRGYLPANHTVRLGTDPVAPMVVELQSVLGSGPERGDLVKQAQALFEKGDFLAANAQCVSLLETDAQDAFALRLRSEIRKQLLTHVKRSMNEQRWSEAARWVSALQTMQPRDPETLRLLQTVRSHLRPAPGPHESSESPQERRVRDLKQQILNALSTGNHLPPKAGNAMDLLSQLREAAPGDSFIKEKSSVLEQLLLDQLSGKVQSRDFAGAQALLAQIQSRFSETSELRTLRDSLRLEESKVNQAKALWLGKAESAFTEGRYVTPRPDCVIAYSQQLLNLESGNARAVALKRQAALKAVEQARTLVADNNFDLARELLSALVHFAAQDSSLPVNLQAIRQELGRLEFRSFPVSHSHAFGGCTGRLRINSYVVSFQPTDSKDGFTHRFSDILEVEGGEKVKVRFKEKTYRFESNLAGSKEEKRQKTQEIYALLTQLKRD
ncbi:MAG: PEGA domain-containing protein [Acidobacteriota bacterium]